MSKQDPHQLDNHVMVYAAPRVPLKQNISKVLIDERYDEKNETDWETIRTLGGSRLITTPIHHSWRLHSVRLYHTQILHSVCCHLVSQSVQFIWKLDAVSM